MATSVSTTPFQIPVRRDIAFNFGANVAQSPAANQRVRHLWYAFSVLGPGAETFFVRVMKRARDEVRDAELARAGGRFSFAGGAPHASPPGPECAAC